MEKIKHGPLSGVNVLDFSWVVAGPHSTKTLADMGANVIKVERFKTGTLERHLPYQVEKNGVTQTSYHINLNRGKKSISVNLKHPKGIELIHDLIKKSDIVVQNFAPGVMKKLNLDYEAMKQIKPDIIYCSISAWGHTGPCKDKPGYDAIAQAASGWIGIAANNTPSPQAIGDTLTAMHACTAMLAALHCRNATGQGQHIDLSLVDCLFSIQELSFPMYWITEAVGKPYVMPETNKTSAVTAPYGVYEGKDGAIVVALMTDDRWPAFVDCLGPGYEWLGTDPRTKRVADRCTAENSQLVHDTLEEWIRSQPSVEEAERQLEACGIPCCRVKKIPELATTDPHLGAREMRVKQNQPFIGEMTMYGSPLKFSETPSMVRGYAPFLGEHNREVFSKYLGYSEEEIDHLYEADILYEAPEVKRLPEELGKMTKNNP